MSPVRITVIAFFALTAAACATPPVRSSAPTGPTAQPRSQVAASVIDVSEVHAAASRLGSLRPAFRSCVETAAGGAVPTQACIDAEMRHQQDRLDTALAARRAGRADVDAVQAQWLVERDRLCGSVAADVAHAHRIRAGICRLEATATRADALAR